MPHLNCTEGDVVFVRATVLEAAADCFKLRVEDFPSYAITFYAPVREIAKLEDIGRLLAPRRERVNGQK